MAGTLDFRSNDYLGLGARHVSRETLLRLSELPLGSLSSRVVCESCPALSRLEQLGAEWLEQPAALVFSSGYAANVGVVPAVALEGDVVLSDALNHASLIDGCRLSRAEVRTYAHCDLADLERKLRDCPATGSRWVLTESYFSMDGDSPDLASLGALCERYQAGLIVDESHAAGVFGEKGAGMCSEAGVRPTITITGLGKAVGSQGGVVAASEDVIDWLWNRARTHFFSTGLSPILAQLSTERIQAVMGAEKERAHLAELSDRFHEKLSASGVRLPLRRHGPLFSVLFDQESTAVEQASHLRAQGVLVQPIRPPTVARGTSRLRLALRADLGFEDVDHALALLNKSIVSSQSRPPSEAEGGSLCSNSRASRPPEELVLATSGADSGAEPLPSVEVEAHSEQREGCSEHLGPNGVARARSLELLPDDSGAYTSAEGDGALHGLLSGLQEASPARTALKDRSLVRARRAGAVREDLYAGSQSPWARSAEEIVSGRERWVVVGCGTEVGKTYVACSLVHALAASAVPVAGLKPIESGLCADLAESEQESDARRLEEASFHVKHPSPHPLFGFNAALSPSIAAREEGQSIGLEPIAAWLESPGICAEEGPCVQVIETAGGLFSPLSSRLTNLDLTISIVPERIVLVAADRLGVLHEVVATLTAMEARGVRPDWIVLSAPQQPDHTTGTNGFELERLLAFPWLIGRVAHLPRGGRLSRPPWLD